MTKNQCKIKYLSTSLMSHYRRHSRKKLFFLAFFKAVINFFYWSEIFFVYKKQVPLKHKTHFFKKILLRWSKLLVFYYELKKLNFGRKNNK